MNIGAGSFRNTVGVFFLTSFTACLLISFCFCFTTLLVPKSLTVIQIDADLQFLQWRSDLSGNSQQWYSKSDSSAVLLPTAALLWNSQLLLCSVLWSTGTVLQGWLAAKILSHERWDRQQPFPGAFPWDSWPSQCHIMLWALCRENQQWNLLWQDQGSLPWKQWCCWYWGLVVSQDFIRQGFIYTAALAGSSGLSVQLPFSW